MCTEKARKIFEATKKPLYKQERRRNKFLKMPITLSMVSETGHHLNDSIKMTIRDGVLNIAQSERLSIYFSEKEKRLYFFVPPTTEYHSYKIRHKGGYSLIQFTHPAVNECFTKGEKFKQLFWTRDEEAELLYIQL